MAGSLKPVMNKTEFSCLIYGEYHMYDNTNISDD